jgi:hypothetical protein
MVMRRWERMLTVLECAGFVAMAAAVGLAGYGFGGLVAGASAGLFALGVEAVYLANAYALRLPTVNGKEPPDA